MYYLEQTDMTPEVRLDEERGLLAFKGESYPEDVASFYEPLIGKVEAFLKQATKIEVAFHLSYFNTSSAKYFYDLLSRLEDAQPKVDVSIKWYYSESDDVMEEHGEDFKMDFSMSFEMIALQDS